MAADRSVVTTRGEEGRETVDVLDETGTLLGWCRLSYTV